MSVQLGSAFGKVELDVSGVTKGVTGANASLGHLDKSLGGAAGSIGRLGTVAGTAGALIASGLTGAVTLAINEAAQAERVMAQTEATIRSTGGAAGFTADEITAMAASFQASTTFADDAVQSMQNVLLTFTNIKGDVFSDASQAILDMSTALGTDLQGAAIQVGKALQDPVEGVSALRRVGVNFSADQQKVIKSLVETGRAAEAQRLILDELAKEFGGSAAAAAGTFEGQIKSLQNSMNDIAEAIGGSFIPVLKEAAGTLDVLINGNKLIQEAQAEVEKQVLSNTSDYQAYMSTMVGVNRAEAEYALILRDIERGVATFDDLARAVGVKTQAEWVAAKAAAAHEVATAKVDEAMKRMRSTMGTLAIEHEKYRTATANAIPLAIEFTATQEELRAKEQELAALEAEITANGPRRVVTVQNEKMSADDLTKAKLQLVVATENLGAAQRKEGESDAEYELRLTGLRDKVADLSNSLGSHQAAVGGATKAQQEHRDELLKTIETMKNAQWAEQGKGAFESLTKAYRDGALGQDEYLRRAEIMNRHFGLYSSSALNAATAQELFVKALTDPNVTNWPTMMAGAKKANEEFLTSAESAGAKTKEKMDAVTNKVNRLEQEDAPRAAKAMEAYSLTMQKNWQTVGTAIQNNRDKIQGVEGDLIRITAREWVVRMRIDVDGAVPSTGEATPSTGPTRSGAQRMPALPSAFTMPDSPRTGERALPSSGIMGNTVTLMDGAIKVYAAEQSPREIAREVIAELGREANLATVSGMGWMGQ